MLDRRAVGLEKEQDENPLPWVSATPLIDLLGQKPHMDDGAIPPPLAERVVELNNLAQNDPEVALGLAASLYERWSEPNHSEFIFDQVVTMSEQLAHHRGLEATLTYVRLFSQQVESNALRNRLQLRIGRLYYEHGYSAKAVIELPVDATIQHPDRYQTLAGLVKAISMVRLRQSRQAIPLLEWVATRSVDREQQARAAMLLGKMHTLYGNTDQARRWLTDAAAMTTIAEQASEARELLAQLDQ